MPNPSRFPSALRRSDGGDIDLTPRRGPSAADIAMMNSTQYKAHMQRKGLWESADLEAIAEARKQNDYLGR